MKVEPDYKSIGSVFRDANIFVIPQYQRGYAWKNTQLDDFVDDVKAVIHSSNGDEHFFGSLVCSREESLGGHELENNLVDGQQRLTTFVLFVSCIISAYEDLNKEGNEFEQYISEKITSLKERYIYYKKSVNKKTIYINRMTLSRRDNTFFRGLIGGQVIEPERESHKRLLNAKEKLGAFLFGELHDIEGVSDKLDHLDKIEKIINESCNVIQMVTNKVSDAYKLFQVINDRGESLNHTDLLRAKTLGLADQEGKEHLFENAETIWDSLDKSLGNDLEKHLGYYFSSVTGDKVKSSSFYDQCMKKLFDNGRCSAEDILVKLQDIENQLKRSKLISSGEWPFIDSTLSSWKRYRLSILIKNLKHTHCIPLLLSACRLGEKTLFNIVRVLEIFFFRYKHICKNRIDPATSRYYRACKEIYSNQFELQRFKDKLRELVLQSSSDEKFASHLMDLKYNPSKSGDNRGVKYLLLGLEDSWRWYKEGMKKGSKGRESSIDQAVIFEFGTMTLEHVYPQNPDVKDLSLEAHLNDIGNLTILDPSLNSSLGNIEYSKKYKYLCEQSNVILNKEFSNYPIWNKESLIDRQKELINAAKCIFTF